MVARRRLPSGFRPQRLARAVPPATHRGIAEVRAALDGDGPTPSVDQTLAERAQWRVMDEAQRRRQCELPL